VGFPRYMPLSSSLAFGAFGVGPLVDRCQSVRGPGIPHSYRAVCITARGYGLVRCAGRRWWVLGQSTRILLLPSGQRSVLIQSIGMGGGSMSHHTLTDSRLDAPAPPAMCRTAIPLAATVNRPVVDLTTDAKLLGPAPARRQRVRLAWPRPLVPVRLTPSRYRVDRALLQPTNSGRGSSNAD